MDDLTQLTERPASDEENARDRHLYGKGPKKMLALDGGGVRGAITVAFLEEIEKLLGEEQEKQGAPVGAGASPPSGGATQPQNKKVRLGDYFDLVGGTSTGAIIATALALGYTISQIKEFYLRLAPRVFKRSFLRLPGLQSKFDARALTDEINAIVGERRLDSLDLITGLGVVAKRMDTGGSWILVNNKKAPYWDSNKYYRLATLVRASTAAPHYFDPEIIALTEDAPKDPLGGVKANLSGRPLLSLLLSKVRALYGMVSKSGPSSETHGLFVDGGVTPHNSPTLALLMMTVLEPLGIRWPLGPENLSIFSIGTGLYRTRVSFADVGFAGPLRLALGALLSMMGDTQYLALTEMQWLGQCMTCWTLNSEIKTLCGETPPGGHWFRFARYDLRLEKVWLSKFLGINLSDSEILKLQGMDDPGIIETIYSMARLAAQKQVKREHLFPSPDANFAPCGRPSAECPRFIGP